MLTLFEQMGYTSLGFHLYRFEVSNWGTFNKGPYEIELKGETALLTGANGSGKSTLVDGLLTLLVPSKKRNYNQASSGTGKKERSEKSYVCGYYGGNSEDESGKRQSLRKEGNVSILLGYFYNEFNSEKVTLAQVLELNNGIVKKFFIIADQELTIRSHFSKITTISDLKKRLKAQGIEIFDKFNDYSNQFRKRFGLDSENALILFNQIVTLKDMGNVNDFIRNYMLEKTDIQETINDLINSYKDLVSCQESIETATQQLEILTPLEEQETKRQKLLEEKGKVDQCVEILSAYFAKEKYRLLSDELEKIEQSLKELEHLQEECDRQKEHLEEEKTDLTNAINNDSVGQRLRELERQIQQQETEIKGKKSEARKYDSIAQKLGFPVSSDRETFKQTLGKIEQKQQEITDQLIALRDERDQHIAKRSEIERDKSALEAELNSLRQRKTQIPQKSLEIQDQIIQALNIDKSDIPFVGELLQVKPDQKEWEYAIEKLLHGFGLSLLVTEEYYQAVNHYVKQTNLRGHLVYYKVELGYLNPTQRGIKLNTVPSKLDIKEDHKGFKEWIFNRLLQQYNYACCELIEEFNACLSYAIIKEGLIKGGGGRHEKDDRSKKSDRSQYILGWNNLEKIKALELQLQDINSQLKQIQETIDNSESHAKSLRQEEKLLIELKRFTNFNQIDWYSIEDSLRQLREEKQTLENSSDSDHLRKTQEKLKMIESDLKECQKKRDTIIGDSRTQTDKKNQYTKVKGMCEKEMNSVDPEKLKNATPDLSNYIRKESSLLFLDNIDKVKETVREKLYNKQKNLISQINDCKSVIIRAIDDFRRKFDATVQEMGDASIESLPEYLALKQRIEKDDLPRHQSEFEKHMNSQINRYVSRFLNKLYQQRDDIKYKIKLLNQSLRELEYNQGTYIILDCSETRNPEIRDFQNDLKQCLENVAANTMEDHKQRFQKIQELLIDRLQSEERWKAKVTDVRNWLEFSVKEYDKLDDSVRDNYTDSSGKSGGEKAKLTYTILLAAIAYQFGIHQENAENKSFRFVVIDEIFSKLDKQYSRYVMERCKQLKLQLLFITPNDKISLAEPYISTLHFVHNNKDKNFSQIHSLTIEQHKQQRQQRQEGEQK